MRYVLIYLIGKGLSRVPYQAIIEVTFLQFVIKISTSLTDHFKVPSQAD